MFSRRYLRKPAWIKVKVPSGIECGQVAEAVRRHNLNTVCREARCPNVAECWSKKSATFLILGRVCTRSCRFCAVATGDPGGHVDANEPPNLAQAVASLGLRYVVITSVDRDDLNDGGAGHYARCVAAIKKSSPLTRIELLIPDFSARPESLAAVAGAGPAVIGHNIETVARLTQLIRDRRCTYAGSLNVLKRLAAGRRVKVKSGFMVGLGETSDEIVRTLGDLNDQNVDIVTIGQYLQPTRRHVPVQKYYAPEEFQEFASSGKQLGLKHVLSGPLVRSSYRAAEIILE